jgi:hypothetical protein
MTQHLAVIYDGKNVWMIVLSSDDPTKSCKLQP